MKIDGSEQEGRNTVPYWLLAELTYRCPLRCPYCSNPLNLSDHRDDLDADAWCDVLEQARRLGAVQLGLSGGEPLLKQGLNKIVQHARHLGFYSNLITSGIGLSKNKLGRLKESGLDHIQLSVQAPDATLSDRIAGRVSFEQKIMAAKLIKSFDFPMVINVVLHRKNIGMVKEIIELALELKADYLELANVQFDGWAFRNRSALLPSREQIDQALKITQSYQEKYKQRMPIYYVIPDYYAERPKPCCQGWGRLSMVVTPSGNVLPCLGAHKLNFSEIPNIKQQDLASIWSDSKLFNAFRGFTWMKEPCRSCPERFQDFGGCRCQAFLLTGDATNTDPVCTRSPLRSKVDQFIKRDAEAQELVYRSFSNS